MMHASDEVYDTFKNGYAWPSHVDYGMFIMRNSSSIEHVLMEPYYTCNWFADAHRNKIYISW